MAADAEPHRGELTGRDQGMTGEIVERRPAVDVEVGDRRP